MREGVRCGWGKLGEVKWCDEVLLMCKFVCTLEMVSIVSQVLERVRKG